MSKAFLGIDPGTKGAMVLYQPDAKPRTVCFEMDGRKQPEETYEWLAKVKQYRPDAYVVLEKIPRAIFGISKSSMSELYGSYRELRMALIVLGFDWREVIVAQPTQTWVREFMVPRFPGEKLSEWKKRHQRAAQGVFKLGTITPENSDAYLLAEYARRMESGKLTHKFKAPPRAGKKKAG